MSMRSRLRGQDGFIREVIWIAVILLVVAVVILDGMAIFNAHQAVDNSTTDAAEAAVTEYAQSLDFTQAKLAASEHLAKSGLELVKFTSRNNPDGTIEFSVTAKATADTYGFRYLAKIPQLKDWVQRTTHPVGTGTAQ